MSNWIILGLAVAVVLLTSIFKTVNLSTKVKSGLAFVLSVAGGGFYTWQHYHGNFTATNFAQAVAYIYAASQLVYGLILKNSNLDAVLGNGSAIQQLISVLKWFSSVETQVSNTGKTVVVNNALTTTSASTTN